MARIVAEEQQSKISVPTHTKVEAETANTDQSVNTNGALAEGARSSNSKFGGRFKLFQHKNKAVQGLEPSIRIGVWNRLANAVILPLKFFGQGRSHGIRRLTSEVLSEFLTTSTAILVILLILAQSAVELIGQSDWKIDANLSVTFVDRTGAYLGERGGLYSTNISSENYPEHLIQSVTAALDRDFMQHNGIISTNTLQGKPSDRGRTTITQMVVRELFLTDTSRKYSAITEYLLVRWLELTHSKREILKLYLDHAYFGTGNFGIASATRYCFGKDVSELTLAESVLLAGILGSRSSVGSQLNLPHARQKSNALLNRMYELGAITKQQVSLVQNRPAKFIHQTRTPTSDIFLDFAFREVKKILPSIEGNNITVTTTLNRDLQSAAETQVWQTIRERGKQEDIPLLSLISLSPAGDIYAMVGSTTFGINRENSISDVIQQPGSIIKPLIFASVIENQLNLRDLSESVQLGDSEWVIVDKNVSPERANLLRGESIFAQNIGTVPKSILQSLTLDSVAGTISELGINLFPRPGNTLDFHIPQMTVLDVAVAYSTFNSGGFETDPHSVVEIADTDGTVLWSRNETGQNTSRILTQETVAATNRLLVANMRNGSLTEILDRRSNSAGKFGVSGESGDSWFAGYTGNLTTIVWFGGKDTTEVDEQESQWIATEVWDRYMNYTVSRIPPLQLVGVPPTQMELDWQPKAVPPKSPEFFDGKLSPGLKNAIFLLKRNLSSISN